MRIKRLVSSLVVALPVLAGCRTDEHLNAPAVLDARFQRYAALGNSITAGFQSAGINDSTQQRSYAVLLGQAMGTSFIRPSLQGRGCPPPFTNNVTQTRVGGGVSNTCDLRTPTTVPNNLAVPGARVEELLNNFGTPVSTSNALTTFILGGKTQIARMAELQPTFVTAWAGNNDVLGSVTNGANPGNPALITPLPIFQQQYDSLADAISATGASAVLIGVADVSVTPFTSKGTVYFCLKTGACGFPAAAFPTNFQVAASCAPALAGGLGDTTLVPWTVGIVRLLTAAQDPGNTYTVDCTVDNDVITGSELAGLHSAVAGFNSHIASVASAHGWAFVDVNPTLLAGRANPAQVAPFPSIPANPLTTPITFGTWFSLDGVHPSSTAHRIVADSVASAINQTYGTSLPVPICGTVTCPAP